MLIKEHIPNDFQFIVQPDGHIKIIDADLYENRHTILMNKPHKSPYRPDRNPRELVERFVEKSKKPAEADMIWGSEVYEKLRDLWAYTLLIKALSKL